MSLSPDHPTDTIENRIIVPDGTLRWQRWSDRAIFDPSGTVTEYQAVGRDITEEKATKEALERSEIRFREQYQNNPLAIFTWQHRDGDFVLIDFNKAAEALTSGRAGTLPRNTCVRSLCSPAGTRSRDQAVFLRTDGDLQG